MSSDPKHGHCSACYGQQRVAVYALPNGRQVSAKHKCQVCGRGEQDTAEYLAAALKAALKAARDK